jgi:hypothetical protein
VAESANQAAAGSLRHLFTHTPTTTWRTRAHSQAATMTTAAAFAGGAGSRNGRDGVLADSENPMQSLDLGSAKQGPGAPCVAGAGAHMVLLPPARTHACNRRCRIIL